MWNRMTFLWPTVTAMMKNDALKFIRIPFISHFLCNYDRSSAPGPCYEMAYCTDIAPLFFI